MTRRWRRGERKRRKKGEKITTRNLSNGFIVAPQHLVHTKEENLEHGVVVVAALIRDKPIVLIYA
jgi:hypothetical protein